VRKKLKEVNLLAVVLSIVSLLIVCSYYFAYGVAKTNNHELVYPQMTKFVTPPDVPVLVYHSVRPIYNDMTEEVKQFTVTPLMFEKQLQYIIESGYRTVSLEDLVLASENKKKLPEKPIVITFDDGWENQYEYAFPILSKYGLTATFFVFTNAIGHERYLTWEQVQTLSDAGMVIGSHSKSHPYLDLIYEREKLIEELAGSKSILENKIKKEVNTFAYPFGVMTPEIATLLKESGYITARKFSGGIYKLGDDPFSIKGLHVTEDFEHFKWLLD